jgi:hypothetical protein
MCVMIVRNFYFALIFVVVGLSRSCFQATTKGRGRKAMANLHYCSRFMVLIVQVPQCKWRILGFIISQRIAMSC